jgi:hypothetical protein
VLHTAVGQSTCTGPLCTNFERLSEALVLRLAVAWVKRMLYHQHTIASCRWHLEVHHMGGRFDGCRWVVNNSRSLRPCVVASDVYPCSIDWCLMQVLLLHAAISCLQDRVICMAPEVFFKLEQVPATASQSRWAYTGKHDDALHKVVYPGGWDDGLLTPSNISTY